MDDDGTKAKPGKVTISFTHLTIFETIMRTRSVTLAAEALDLPQPTVSRYLKQLREHFDNPLFVRTSHGLEPTSHAAGASAAVSQALELYRTKLSAPAVFDPEISDRKFRIAASDVGHLLVLPPLFSCTNEIAPGVSFVAVPLGGVKLIAQMEAGEVDLAIGSFPALYAGVMEQTLFEEEYVCVVPRRVLPEGRLTQAQFRNARHVLVDGRHLGHIHEEVEKRLRKLCGEDKISILADHFLLSAHIAEQSDLILTAPSRLAGVLDPEKVRILPPPIPLPGFSVKQYWHERSHDDPGISWLRGTLAGMRKAWESR